MLLNDKVPFRMQWPQFADLQVNGMVIKANDMLLYDHAFRLSKAKLLLMSYITYRYACSYD